MSLSSLSRQRYLLHRGSIALIAGLLCTLLSLYSSFQQLQLQAEQQQQKAVQQLQDYFQSLLPQTHSWQEHLLTLSDQPCATAQLQLQKAAARDHSARSYLLVQQGQIYCSSTAPEEAQMLGPLLAQLMQRPSIPILIYDPLNNSPMLAYWRPQPTQPQQGLLYVQDLYSLTHILMRPQRPFVTGLTMDFNYPTKLTLGAEPAEAAPDTQPLMRWQDTAHQVTLNLYGPNKQQLLPMLMGMPVIVALLLGLCIAMLVFHLYSDRHHFGHDLRSLIRQRRLKMHYQPLIDGESGRCIGVEALLRWQPDNTLQSPDAFIAQLEQHQLMPHLTHHLMTLIAEDIRQLPAALLPNPFRLSVNISPDHFNDPALLTNTRKLRAALPAQVRLVLEITERSPLNFNSCQSQLLHALQTLPDVVLALDDFGTGHCTLGYLNQIRPHYLKIDRRFTASIDTPGMDTVVLDSIIALAQRLDIALIAEGVESGRQAMYLRQKGVQTLQGFLFARPMQVHELKDWLQNPAHKFAVACPLSLESIH
ncbi:MAG: EAL domain-containing protein [Plesiomonas sp.]